MRNKPLMKKPAMADTQYGGRGKKHDPRSNPLHTGTGYCCDLDYMQSNADRPAVKYGTYKSEYESDLSPRVSR